MWRPRGSLRKWITRIGFFVQFKITLPPKKIYNNDNKKNIIHAKKKKWILVVEYKKPVNKM